MATSFKIGNTKIRKYAELQDNQGRKIERKVRRDDKGLFVIVKGMKGRLIRTTRRHEACEGRATIRTTRTVSHYEAA
jgi:hypothetical protein